MFKLFDPVLECVFDKDLSCKFSKLQYYSLAFVAVLKRATGEGSLPEIAQYSPYYFPLNDLLLPKDQTFLFYLLLLQLVLCRVAALKKSPRTSSIVQIIFYLGPLKSVKIFRVFKTLTLRNVLLSNV